ncbi:MAG: hypothetical protein EOL98_10930 [Negativicutes bacterium]|nr:hypothetical protein [Negativicutes bacterium]
MRIGLQTPYIGEARRIATKLRVRMDEILDENVPVSPEHLRKELLARFIKVLEQDEKIQVLRHLMWKSFSHEGLNRIRN